MLTTQNEAYGFWGTMNLEGEGTSTRAWPLAMAVIKDATATDDEEVRAFLDSRWGRHFADMVHNNLHEGQSLREAIGAAVDIWQGWTVSRATQREYGIPEGIPYLTGFVVMAGIEAEAA